MRRQARRFIRIKAVKTLIQAVYADM